ncbi:hypothetical protein GCM10007886_13270 [Methylobacterium gregans]|nr:hypothetical protein GCM10007886_13270 [Methylobacterium gregans]
MTARRAGPGVRRAGLLRHQIAARLRCRSCLRRRTEEEERLRETGAETSASRSKAHPPSPVVWRWLADRANPVPGRGLPCMDVARPSLESLSRPARPVSVSHYSASPFEARGPIA